MNLSKLESRLKRLEAARPTRPKVVWGRAPEKPDPSTLYISWMDDEEPAFVMPEHVHQERAEPDASQRREIYRRRENDCGSC